MALIAATVLSCAFAHPTFAQVADIQAEGPWLEVGKTLKGELSINDTKMRHDEANFDAYRIQVQAGESYRLTYRATDKDFDPLLLLLTPQGNLVNLNDDFSEDGENLDSQLTWTADKDRVLVVYTLSITAGAEGKYTLQLESIQADEVNNAAPASNNEEPDVSSTLGGILHHG